VNKRIKQLAHQADWDDEFREDFDIEKFAQLIGRECLSIADSIRDGCDEDGESQQALGAAWVGIAIARHFGVEE
jgi:hypothetical protein